MAHDKVTLAQLKPDIEPEPRTIVMQLHRAMDPEILHYLFGQTLKRIRAFAEKHDTDADPLFLSREVERDFAKDTNQDFFLVVAVREGRVIGHFLSRAEFYFGRRFVFINQLDVLGAGLSEEQIDYGFELLKDWARSLPVVGIRMSAPTEAHVRLYRKRGFIPRFMILRWDF